MQLEFLLYLSLCALVLLGCFYYISKLYEMYSKRVKLNPLNEFISDLYKLQAKQTKKGQYEYSEALNLVIKSFYKEREPETEYGRTLKKSLNKEDE